MNYTDENRGKFQCLERAKQLISFEGLQYGHGSPTDVDGLLEFDNKVFVFFELKHRNAVMPQGQKLALERIINNLDLAGKKSVLFVASHSVDNPEQKVFAADSRVTGVYFKGRWHSGGGTLKQRVDDFLAWAI